MHERIAAIVVGVSMMGFAGVARAGTPDGETPAQETVCDGEVGAAHGLCNAYCEAMDCHLDAPNASAQACENVRDKFMNKTGRDLPCESACPCESLESWNEGLYGGLEYGFCLDGDLTQAMEFGLLLMVAGEWFDGTYVCGYYDFVAPEPVTTEITPEQAAVCQAQILVAVEESGGVCTDGAGGGG